MHVVLLNARIYSVTGKRANVCVSVQAFAVVTSGVFVTKFPTKAEGAASVFRYSVFCMHFIEMAGSGSSCSSELPLLPLLPNYYQIFWYSVFWLCSLYVHSNVPSVKGVHSVHSQLP